MTRKGSIIAITIVVILTLIICSFLGLATYGTIVGFEYTGKITNVSLRGSNGEDPYFIVTFDPKSDVQEARFNADFQFKGCNRGDIIVYKMKLNGDTEIESCKSP